jgi:hypothetical protein
MPGLTRGCQPKRRRGPDSNQQNGYHVDEETDEKRMTNLLRFSFWRVTGNHQLANIQQLDGFVKSPSGAFHLCFCAPFPGFGGELFTKPSFG